MKGSVALVLGAMLAAASGHPLFGSISAATGLGTSMIGGMRTTANTLGSAKSTAVQSGTDAFKAGVSMGAGMASMIPGIGSFANLGATMLNAKADTVNNMVQGKIKAALALENAKLNMMGSGLTVAGNAASAGSSLLTSLPSMATSVSSSLPGVSSLSNVASTMTSSIPGASSLSNIASSVSSSIPGASMVTSALSGNTASAPAANVAASVSNVASSVPNVAAAVSAAAPSTNNAATAVAAATGRSNGLLSMFNSFTG